MASRLQLEGFVKIKILIYWKDKQHRSEVLKTLRSGVQIPSVESQPAKEKFD